MANEKTTAQDPTKQKRRRRWGDRKDGYKVRTINPMNKFMPYIMPERSDACNTYADEFDVTKTDRFCREKVKEGKKNFSFLHIIIVSARGFTVSRTQPLRQRTKDLFQTRYSSGYDH